MNANASSQDNKDKWENIKEGIIIYLAFMKEATNEAIDEASKKFKQLFLLLLIRAKPSSDHLASIILLNI